MVDSNEQTSTNEIKIATYIYDNILDLQVVEDGKTIIQTSRDDFTGIGRTLVGGVVAGVPGAMVGVASTTKIVRDYLVDLKITVADPLNPIYRINFLSCLYGKNSVEYKEALKNAHHWHGVLSAMIKRAKEDDGHRVDKFSVADELNKLAELLKYGILNQEEFDRQKDKLLSN